MDANRPSAPQLMTDRILVRWERDFDIVIPTLVSSEKLGQMTSHVR